MGSIFERARLQAIEIAAHKTLQAEETAQ